MGFFTQAEADAATAAGVVFPDGVARSASAPNLVSGRTVPTTSKWNYHKARVRLGRSDVIVAAIGASTTAGQGGSNTGASGNTGARPLSFPAQAAAIMNGYGFPTSPDAIFGNNLVDSTTRDITKYTTFNPAVVAGAGWVVADYPTAGGYAFENTTTTNAFAWTPTLAFDLIDIYIIKQTGNGSLTVDIGGAVLQTINTDGAGASSIAKITVSTGGAEAVGTVNLKRVSGIVRVIGIITRSSTKKRVIFANLGASGSRASLPNAAGQFSWNNESSAWSPRRMLRFLAADTGVPLAAVDFNLGHNDIINSDQGAPVALADYLIGMNALISDVGTSASVFINTLTPLGLDGDPTNARPAFNAAIQDLAKSTGSAVIDLGSAYGSWADADAQGYMYDRVHFKVYARTGEIVAQALLNT